MRASPPRGRRRAFALALSSSLTLSIVAHAQAPAPTPEPEAAPAPAAEPAPEPTPAPAPAPALDPASLTATIDARIAAAAAAAAAASAAKPSAGYKDGFFISSADGKSKLKLGAYTHADARFLLGDGTGDTLVLRRVRPTFDGTVAGRWDFKFLPDFGQGRTVIQDAYVDAHFSELIRVRIGKLKQPFGLGRLQSATALTFVERGHPTNLAPNRDLGVQLHGEVGKGLVQYQAGVFAGVPDGGSSDGDSDEDKDVALRVFSHPLIRAFPRLGGLGLGGAVTYGKRTGTPAAPQVAPYKSASTASFFSYAAGTTADTAVVASGGHLRATGQGYLYHGPFSLLGEFVWSRQALTRAGVEKQLAHRAWGVEVSYVLTGEKTSFKGITPRTVFDPEAGTFGAFEVAARYNETRIDRDAFDDGFADLARSARRARAFAVAASWTAAAACKLVVSFERTDFRGGAPAGADRPAENLLATRVQSVF